MLGNGRDLTIMPISGWFQHFDILKIRFTINNGILFTLNQNDMGDIWFD